MCRKVLFLKQVLVLVLLAMSQKQKVVQQAKLCPQVINESSLPIARRSRRKNTATEKAQSASRVNPRDNEEMDAEESGSETDDDHDHEVKVKELRLAYRKKFGKLPQNTEFGWDANWLQHSLRLRSSTTELRKQQKLVKKRLRSKRNTKIGRASKKQKKNKKKIGSLNYDKSHEKMRDVRTLIQTSKAIWRHPYVGKEVWKYIYPKFEAGIITDVQPANIRVGDQVEANGEEGSIVKILKGQQYRLKFKKSGDLTCDQKTLVKMLVKKVVFKHTVKFANGKTESIVGSDEIKKLVSPLKANDGVVTQFNGEIASLWVIEHRCVQNETRGSYVDILYPPIERS